MKRGRPPLRLVARRFVYRLPYYVVWAFITAATFVIVFYGLDREGFLVQM